MKNLDRIYNYIADKYFMLAIIEIRNIINKYPEKVYLYDSLNDIDMVFRQMVQYKISGVVDKIHFLGIEKSGGANKVNIKIDASRVAGLITGSANLDKVVYDTWYLKDVELMSGKIYGLVSEYGQGCMYLSYLLGGKIDFGDLQIFIDGIDVSKEDLKSISWNLEPSKEKYKNKTVRKSIEKSIIKNKCSDTFEDIVEAFYLDERRHDIKLQYLSGERWRASAALGYVSGKSIFYAPYENTSFYHSMYGSNMFKALRYLADKGTIIVLPVGSDTFIKSVVDECIYLDPVYEQ